MVDYHSTLRHYSLLRRKQLLPLIYSFTGGKVISGPFKDTVITPYYIWGDGDTAGKLLGIYEDELHPFVEIGISQNPDLVINVGAAEGFYAVGLKKKINCYTIAVDIEPKSFDYIKINASANNVTIDELKTHISLEEYNDILGKFNKPWLVLDCEGYENSILDPIAIPNLKKTIILVETHDCYINNLTEDLEKRMSKTHDVTRIQQGVKNPFNIEFLNYLHETDKWALVDEGRGQTGTWLWMTPK